MNDPSDPGVISRLLTRWQSELALAEWGTTEQLRASLGHGSDPVAVMLTCAELGNIPDTMAGAQPGEMMVVQNLAGIVPAYGKGESCLATMSIRRAVRIPTVRHLIVCGHRRCNVVPELLSDRRPELFAHFREIIAEIRDDLLRVEGDRSKEWLRDLAVQQVILQQLRHLRSYPQIRQPLAESRLLLHGWMYDDESMSVHPFDQRSGRFCRDCGTGL